MLKDPSTSGAPYFKFGRFFIYPSWAHFSRKWCDLPELFLSPETWGPDFDLTRLIDLGYSVKKGDHKLFDGPQGGGLIQVFRTDQRWFPAVLFTRETMFRTPKGFHGMNVCPIAVLVPWIKTQHKILGEPIPIAPSPHFSVEQLQNGANDDFVALGLAKPNVFDDGEFRAGFPSLELKLERLEKLPEKAREAFEHIEDPRLTWLWYKVQYSHLTPILWVAAMIYLGLRLAEIARNNVRDMHIFTTKFVPGDSFPSARLWTSRRTKGVIRTPDDW